MTKDTAQRINAIADRLRQVPASDKRTAKRRSEAYVRNSNAIEGDALRPARKGRIARASG